MTAWHVVGDVASLERDGRIVARVGGREIGVVRGDGGTLYALRNRCPHHGAPLCLGEVLPRAVGAPGTYATDGPVLRCPWHGWEFDPETGACLVEATMRVAVYDVKVEDGRVLVQA